MKRRISALFIAVFMAAATACAVQNTVKPSAAMSPPPLAAVDTGAGSTGTDAVNMESPAENAEKDESGGTDPQKSPAPGPEIREIEGLVLLKDLDDSFVIDLRYATVNNFTGKKVYPSAQCVLRKDTAQKLVKANAGLKELGYRLKIWDAYRPLHVQQLFWDMVRDSRYVANPKTGGSNHNRGAAVDVTLVDRDGKEVLMPSGFDDFSQKASRNQAGMDPKAKENMDLLTSMMIKNGFRPIDTEWWHFDDTASSGYTALDVRLEDFDVNREPEEGAGAMEKNRQEAPEKPVAYRPDPESLRCLGDSGQVLIVAVQSAGRTKAKLQAFEKVGGSWSQVLRDIPAVIGEKGLTSNKTEGDKKSPQGVYALGACYGREANPGTKMPFVRFAEDSYWVDDADSPFYNTYQTGPANGRWKSAESLYRAGYPYKYFVRIDYNTEKIVKGKGSAIFLHIWKGEGMPTNGCTAVSEENLLTIIKWLDPAKKPVIIQGTEEEISKM